MRRVSVVGTSGSGKSWLAVRLAAALEVPHLELDSLRHQAGWQQLPDDEFARRVTAFVEQDGWVVDGNYFSTVTERVVWPRADTVVWIDLPKAKVMRQIVHRTLRRGLARQELWNGNRESLVDFVRWDPQKSVIRWSWLSYPVVKARNEAAMTDPRWSGLEFVRLRSRAEIGGFLGRYP